MNAIILCGGLSTRLGDITKSTPKVLLQIGEKTVLDWQLEKLMRLGISEVVLAAGHLSDVLRDEVGIERNGMKITYAVEPQKLGTGGAIKFALGFVANKEDPTMILNGDILTTTSLHDIAATLRADSDGLIFGARVENAASYGTLESDETGRLTAFKEKEGKQEPGYINGGVYIFTPHMHHYFPEEAAFSVEYDVFPKMTNLYVYQSDDPWIDVGVPERLAWARKHWRTYLE